MSDIESTLKELYQKDNFRIKELLFIFRRMTSLKKETGTI